ncbi:TonB-dependent receptor [Cellulophaga baltica]|uniref:TonB-dependent receptor n=1 Tax=Cellulophaga TaxID=104264 RepID=UPI001C06D356|nr:MULTISPECIES: TonB-dependent receptor [Cellulophaga]MBU2996293.1 TonB-dependent receptor [Cellulophaga baltica]MDO6767688.1 TonB-dependent receptor [Cellulophaga sp. 1_MG-2023]
MSLFKKYAFFLLILFYSSTIFSQASFSGKINDRNGKPIVDASVVLNDKNFYAITDWDGNFKITEIPSGIYEVSISHLGYKTLQTKINFLDEGIKQSFVLESDYLDLQNVIVTGTFDPRTQLESSTSVSVLNSKKLQTIYPKGTASLLQNISGTFVDAAAGEVFTKVYTRGISASAEDDLGWYYISLQEDGLPVSLTQHSYISPDIFYRADISTQKVEALRGGSASITAMNAPGGIYNFISHGISNEFEGEVQLSGGLQGDQNGLYRIDTRVGGAIGNNWYINAGGHYRYDEGARNTNFTFGKGGQFKFNLIKKLDKGYLKFYGKILNDKTNRWTGVAATNWDNPTAAFGQDFGSTSLLMPSFNGAIPDVSNITSGATNSFDPSQGVHAEDLAFGVDFLYELGNNWTLKNNLKVSLKDANWQTSISNAYVSLDNPLAYFISGAGFPVGEVVFTDAVTGEEVARVDNTGILTGGEATYLTDGTLPNDGIMGTSAWYKKSKADEFMNQFILRKQLEKHDITLGFDLGFSDNSIFTQGTFGFTTYEPSPRMLSVTLENSGSPVIALSDDNGLSNYGGLFFENARAKVSQVATFLNDRWKIADKWYLDLGVRTENINHKGSKDRYETLSQDGGFDGDEATAYDNGVLVPTGEQDEFNFTYNYISYSAGANYKMNNNTAVFGRFSRGNKAPELDYYYNNFTNVPINQKGEIQKITQAELGFKYSGTNFSFTSTVFWSQLENIRSTNFEFDEDSNSVFYTPYQFNTSKTLGVEWESIYAPFNNFLIKFDGVLQNPKASKWTVYDAAGSADTSDDSITDYSKNTLAYNPKIMFNLSAEYQKNKLSLFYKWQFMGEREGNVANAFQLAPYSTFKAGVGYQITNYLKANLLVDNIFNSEGLTNFFGANSFGASANGVTSDYITENPDGSFIVVPVLPRSSLLKLSYTF